ncbi:hypothetical protein BRADI_1g08142v3 [Brachypodium distachyon]|uniref:DUF834 domain-containing protein n=1 Tax=Brachypodium distachyon TaxID=15368 RepID=A0A2K2DIK4_BRADI|nr:hypothetical protein BRADI_1g08142v3 [Brachypodium distachyon]
MSSPWMDWRAQAGQPRWGSLGDGDVRRPERWTTRGRSGHGSFERWRRRAPSTARWLSKQRTATTTAVGARNGRLLQQQGKAGPPAASLAALSAGSGPLMAGSGEDEGSWILLTDDLGRRAARPGRVAVASVERGKKGDGRKEEEKVEGRRQGG